MSLQLDPMTMAPDELRHIVRETHKAMRGAWVQQAKAFRRIRDEGLYQEWGFDGWHAYLRSDLPGLSKPSSMKMIRALGYLELTEGGIIDDPPGYGTTCDLDTVRRKVSSGVVSESDWLALHATALGQTDEQCSDSEITRRCSRLSKGMRLGSGSTSDPITKALDALALAAHCMGAVGAMNRRGELGLDVASGGGEHA